MDDRAPAMSVAMPAVTVTDECHHQTGFRVDAARSDTNASMGQSGVANSGPIAAQIQVGHFLR